MVNLGLYSDIKGTYLFLRREVVDDVEQFADFLRGLALDHVRHCLATDIARQGMSHGPQETIVVTRTAEA